MGYVELYNDRTIRKQITKTILRGQLLRGMRTNLAREFRVSEPYISALFDPGNRKAIPAPKNFRRFVQGLNLKKDIAHLDDNYRASRGISLELPVADLPFRFEALDSKPLPEVAAALWAERERANFSPFPDITRSTFEDVRAATIYFLPNPELDPDGERFELFAEFCLLRHEVQCILGQPWDALLHAKIGRKVVEDARRSYNRFGVETTKLLLGLIEAESICLSNLGCRDLAFNVFMEGEELRNELDKKAPGIRTKSWSLQTEANFKARLPKFSIGNAIQLHEETLRISEKEITPEHMLHSIIFASDLTLARAYIARESWKTKTAQQLEKRLNDVTDDSSFVTAMHRVMYHRTYARFLKQQGRSNELSQHLQRAIDLAVIGSFDHQLQQIFGEFEDEVRVLNGG